MVCTNSSVVGGLFLHTHFLAHCFHSDSAYCHSSACHAVYSETEDEVRAEMDYDDPNKDCTPEVLAERSPHVSRDQLRSAEESSSSPK